MKIDRKKYPILDYYYKGTFRKDVFMPKDIVYSKAYDPRHVDHVASIIFRAKPPVYYVTEEIKVKIQDSFIDMIPRLPELESCARIILTRDATYMYAITISGNGTVVIACFVFQDTSHLDGKKDQKALAHYIEKIYTRWDDDGVYTPQTFSFKQQQDTIISTVIGIELFLNFAQVETIEMPATQRKRTTPSGNFFQNEAQVPIIIVDKGYFITRITVDPGGVKGHWRNQRYGKGRTEVRRVFIKEHCHKGYVRKAKKLKQ